VSVSLHGHVEPGFGPVADAFVENFSEHGEVGAAVCVYRDALPVVDLWAGLADRDVGRPWEETTAALVFSTTKGVTAACANLLIERGQLELDHPIAAYWPEFAAAGKERIPVRWALSHQAGLAAVAGELTLEAVLAWDPVVAAIAAQAPNWEPGTAHGYHARSYGWIVGELVRRITGVSLGRFFATEMAAPLGLDFWIGLPASEEGRLARIYPPEPPADPDVRAAMEAFMGPSTLLGRVLTGPSGLFGYNDMWNRPELHAAEMPSSNGIGTAPALARFYGALIGEVDGVRLLRAATVAAAREVQAEGPDRVLGLPTRFGLGFALPPMLGPGLGPAAFGHPGAGGSLGFADPDAGLGFGYVMNQMKLGVTGDQRTAALISALYGCL
jgi:CubicO group peptidase (beta-lactamase class C family)